MMKYLRIFILSLFIVLIYSSLSFAQDNNSLEKAVALYQHEDYEEALSAFLKLQAENPSSSTIAYYLGLTYKQLQDVVSARRYLEEAVNGNPPVKGAIPDLIDVLYQCDKIKEAKEWIARAEQEKLSPAQVEFLKGVVLMKDEPENAALAFDEVIRIDPSYTKTANYYKGMALMQAKKYAAAKDVFRKVMISDVTSDMASFASEYTDVISKREDYDKPFHANVTVTMQYDSNVILEPVNEELATGIGNKGDWRTMVNGMAEYNVKASDKISIKGGYSFYAAKQFDLGFYDALSNDFSVTPAYTMDKMMVAFPAHYLHYHVNDKYYLSMVGFGPMANIMLDRDNMAHLSFTHSRKYFNWQANLQDDTQDSFDYAWSAGWFYFFTKMRDGFVNLRYAMNYELAKGNNWTHFGNRITATAVTPVGKSMRLTTVVDYLRQDFLKLNSTYEKARTDDVLTVSSMFSIMPVKNVEIQLSYSFVNDAASIGIFNYTRNVYGVGVKYSF